MRCRNTMPLALVFALFLLAMYPAREATAQEHMLKLSGEAFNTSVATAGSVDLVISTEDSLSYRARGAFDGVTLAGAFDVYGRTTEPCLSADLCLLFTGALTLDGIAGWPAGTATTFVLSLAVQRAGEAIGVYHLGSLPGFDFTQHGFIEVAGRPGASPEKKDG